MLSIIIVNYKTSGEIDFCLKSIMRFEPHYRDYEFIIIDNNSNDSELKNLKEKYPFVKIIYAPRNGGFAYGNNLGIKASQGEYILLLNPDTYIENNSIEKLYVKLKNSKDIFFAGPQLLNPDRSIQSYSGPKSYLTLWRLFCERLYLPRIFKRVHIFNSYLRTYMDYNKEIHIEQICGAVFMFKKSVVKKIGLLDEKYFMYFEESDYCLQAVRKGIKMLYYPESKVFHLGGLIKEDNWDTYVINYVSSFKYYFRKNFGFFSCYIAIYLHFLGSFLRVCGLLLKGDKKYRFHLLNIVYLFRKLKIR